MFEEMFRKLQEINSRYDMGVITESEAIFQSFSVNHQTLKEFVKGIPEIV
jgi:hypothetical protein